MPQIRLNLLLKHRYSFIAGTCAAGGSFFGKLPSYLAAQQLLLGSHFGWQNLDYILLHVLPFALMLICNVLNLRFFLKALANSEQTLTVTVLTAASNYILSFILGCAVYQEHITPLSGIGSTLIIAGLWFLCDAPQVAKDGNETKVKQQLSKED